MADLTILYTGDLHGKLTPTKVERIRGEKATCGECLLLDSGDAVSSGNVYYRPGGEPILAHMSDAGYDAMTLGNREFHFLSAGLKSKVSLARFPVLCANLRCKNSSREPSVIPSVRLEVSGLQVALFGLTVPMITPGMLASKVSPYWFESPVESAKSVVPTLRDSADLVIALTHIGIKADMELAAQVSGIDLIVGGHTHVTPTEPVVVGATSIAHAGWWGHYLGRVEMTRTASGWQASTQLIDLRAGGGR